MNNTIIEKIARQIWGKHRTERTRRMLGEVCGLLLGDIEDHAELSNQSAEFLRSYAKGAGIVPLHLKEVERMRGSRIIKQQRLVEKRLGD